MNLYRDVGCSQEDHLPNCSHFGESGAYLSEHSAECKKQTGGGTKAGCICNPKARKDATRAKNFESMTFSEMLDFWTVDVLAELGRGNSLRNALNDVIRINRQQAYDLGVAEGKRKS